jgi:hypothetical protein
LIVAAPSAHIDETSWSEASEKAWLWVGLTGDLTAFRIADNRGADVARAIVGTAPEKVVISDRFPSYDWVEQHQYCWSHLLRAHLGGRPTPSLISTPVPSPVAASAGTANRSSILVDHSRFAVIPRDHPARRWVELGRLDSRGRAGDRDTYTASDVR